MEEAGKTDFKIIRQDQGNLLRLPWILGGMSLGILALCPLTLAALLIVSLFFNVYLASGLEIVISRPGPVSAAVAIATPLATPAMAATMPAATPLTVGPPPALAPSPTATPTPALPTPIPPPMAGYTIAGLRARDYPGGVIEVRSVLTVTGVFTRYYINYPSDDLTITGVMQVPRGEGPFPVIILNHGFIARHRYWSGADTASAAAHLNRHGYLTVAPDFRGWGESDTDNSFFNTGFLIDALNLLSSLPSLPEADVERVGMWGHSMGGGVTTKAIAVDPRIKAAVLYAPVSANEADMLELWGPGCRPGQRYRLSDKCNGAEVLMPGIDETLFLAYADAVRDPQLLRQISPANYFDDVVAPVQIHIGTVDAITPPEWSAAIRRALQGAGKAVEYFAYPGQGHALKGEAWTLFMERTTDFFDHHLDNTSRPAASAH